ncbi:MAG: aminopeptidase P family protein [Clostridia bacterium]|nr:aminopeptidase P family protein [Clostridia bacterium]
MNISILQSQLALGEAALLLSEENTRYFTSFPSTNAALLVTKDTALYWTDSRYLEEAQRTVTGCDDVLELKTLKDSVAPAVVSCGAKSLLLEGARITVKRYETVKALFPSCTVDADRLDTLVDHIRAVKTDEEVAAVTRAQRIAETALRGLLPEIRPGAVERELQLMLDVAMLRGGAEALSFDTILISGSNTSKPHGVPTDKKIARGDFVTIDFGAVVRGYHSDMTRTFAVGEVSDKMKQVYDTVLAAQTAGLAALFPGKTGKEIDTVSRDVIAQAGFGECFGHGLGHGVGVEIHENPVLNQRSDWVLQQGHIVTVEPGIYLPGEFGVRIEDMALITPDGCRSLTDFEKDLIIL